MKKLNRFLFLILLISVTIQLGNVLSLYELSDAVIRMNGMCMILGIILLTYTTMRLKQMKS